MADIQLSFYFDRSNEIEECRYCECDSFSATDTYYRLPWTGRCGRQSPDYLNYYDRLRGRTPRKEIGRPNAYLRLKTDDSIHLRGINISFIVKSNSRKLLPRFYCF